MRSLIQPSDISTGTHTYIHISFYRHSRIHSNTFTKGLTLYLATRLNCMLIRPHSRQIPFSKLIYVIVRIININIHYRCLLCWCAKPEDVVVPRVVTANDLSDCWYYFLIDRSIFGIEKRSTDQQRSRCGITCTTRSWMYSKNPKSK